MVGGEQQRHITSHGDKAAREAVPRPSVEHKFHGDISEDHDRTMSKVRTGWLAGVVEFHHVP